MRTTVIAEVGVNHNGSLDLALRLVDEVAAAGAQAVKFQTFKADAVVARNTAVVQYQRDSGASDQHAMLQSLELSAEAHHILADRCRALGIEFMSTAFDKEALNLLLQIGIGRIKIPSGELTNVPFLRDCANCGLPIIMSTGMADLAEVQFAVDVIRGATPGAEETSDMPPLVVLHCTSAYPTNLADVNLRAMTMMADKLGLPAGYSDHTVGILVPPIAVAMGAVVIEKHVTLDRTMPGPDHAASIEPAELRTMILAIADAEQLCGDGVKRPTAAELEARALVRRGLKASRDLAEGAILRRDDIAILRPASGAQPGELEQIIGRVLNRSLLAGAPIDHVDLT